ncbi:MAG: phosphatidylserine decarboxylase [Gammaproteobacteria bacterium]|jgi:phosphatidylserine decarboxylase|nr:phosphatidylserine decarboxylase [Gammaproteobacteria bacterium]
MKLSIWHQYCLPQHFLSRFLGRIANIRCKFFKNLMIKLVIKKFKVNMSEAQFENLDHYASFNEFFIRHLKADARPFPHNNLLLASPSDGVISQFGQIKEGRLIQAKGHDFSLMELLGGESSAYKEFLDGEFATIYLSPKDYHRIHMPLSGNLRQMTYVPGKLFSVSPKTTTMVPELFARNERVICCFDSEFGPFALVLVGAFFVASIATSWAGVIAPNNIRKVQNWDYAPDQQIHLKQGDEMGYFQFGSTVIMLLPKGMTSWRPELTSEQFVKLGQVLANIDQ